MDRLTEKILWLNIQANKTTDREEANAILTEVKMLDAIRRAKRYV
jgi:hypothetical protein